MKERSSTEEHSEKNNDNKTQAYELKKLRNAPNAMRREDWANNIAGYVVNERLKLDQLSNEMGINVSYDGYDDEKKIMKISIREKEELKYKIEIDANSGDINVNDEFYEKFDNVWTIGKVLSELIEKLQEEYIEGL